MNSNALLIFIKNPVLGKVKTRLAATVGADKALKVYFELLRHTREISSQVEADRFLCYSDAVEEHDDWSNEEFIKKTQTGADLGARMSNAFKVALIHNKKVVIIGSDCPLLQADHLAVAFAKLEEYPFVIGPALDGGYYLLGMRQFSPEVFEHIEWSTDAVFSATLENIKALGQTCFQLPPLPDVDTEADWKAYGWEIIPS